MYRLVAYIRNREPLKLIMFDRVFIRFGGQFSSIYLTYLDALDNYQQNYYTQTLSPKVITMDFRMGSATGWDGWDTSHPIF